MSEGSPNPSIPQEGASSSEEEDQWRPNNHQHNHQRQQQQQSPPPPPPPPPPSSSERKSRLPRACAARASARLKAAAAAAAAAAAVTYAPTPPSPERSRPSRREREERLQCSRIVTALVAPPPPADAPRWTLRSMWELSSILNFLHVFRPLLNITVEFTAEELEMAFIAPNSTLADIHIPLLKAIPPITRMALGRATWVTVLCRKLRDWWHWVADGDIPIVASHGAEAETYMTLEPSTRVLILKAICDIRVEQDDIRSYIDRSMKHGMQLSTFRGERFGGDSHGVSYWYEDDPLIGHRLYREIRQIDVKKAKGKGMPSTPIISCQWETVASNLDEFQDVADKLLESKNRMEVSIGKKLRIDVIPEVERLHKRKERTLKKQHREALLLDSFLTADGLTAGRSLRDRKPVTYTFDDFDRSINEAIKITKKRPSSPEQPILRRESSAKAEISPNGRINGPSQIQTDVFHEVSSPKFSEETDEEVKDENLDRSNRQRKRPQRYSEKEFIGALSDNDLDFESDDDIVGEAVYDEEYLRNRKQRKVSSSSEGDEEYSWQEENGDDEDEEDSLSISEDSDEYRRTRRASTRSGRGTRLRAVNEIQTAAPRRSKRSTRPRINYRQYEFSDSNDDSSKLDKSGPSGRQSDSSTDVVSSAQSRDSDGVEDEDEEMKDHNLNNGLDATVDDVLENGQNISQTLEKASSPRLGGSSMRRTQFLDLNELAPSTGYDDGLGSPFKGENGDS